MKLLLLFLFAFLTAGSLRATEKLWIPLGTPVGQTVEAVQATPNAQGTAVLMANPTVQPTETVVPGVRVKDGHWAYKYPDNHTESEGDYDMGKKNGVWKYYSADGSEVREMEFSQDRLTGGAVLFGVNGGQKYTDHITDMVQKVVPVDFKVKNVLPYWLDLLGDGDHQILVIARGETSSMVLVMDPNGNLLDSKVFNGLVDDFIFGEIKKGGPICFGYDMACDAGLGVCQWEFDVWDGSKLKTVLQYQGWYGKNAPFTLPVFQYVLDQPAILTDNGHFQWDENQQMFVKASN